MPPFKHSPVLRRLANGDESWTAPVPAGYGTFLGSPLRLEIMTCATDVSCIADPSPPPTPMELALAETILDHLPTLLAEAQRRFTHYVTETTDDPDAVRQIARPTIWISRDVQTKRGNQRWSLTVERHDISLGYAIEFDGLRYLETWAAT